jgi:hypothetical protein
MIFNGTLSGLISTQSNSAGTGIFSVLLEGISTLVKITGTSTISESLKNFKPIP